MPRLDAELDKVCSQPLRTFQKHLVGVAVTSIRGEDDRPSTAMLPGGFPNPFDDGMPAPAAFPVEFKLFQGRAGESRLIQRSPSPLSLIPAHPTLKIF